MMVQTIDRIQDRRLVHSGISWQQFKSIQVGFADSPGIRLFYFDIQTFTHAIAES